MKVASVFGFMLLLGSGLISRALFSPAFLQNESYWGDGKAEVDFYDADLVRNGQHFRCELLLTVKPGFIDPLSGSPVAERRATECEPVVRIKYSAAFNRGLLSEQRSWDVLCAAAGGRLIRLSFVGSDGIGNISRVVSPKPATTPAAWLLSEESYQGVTLYPPILSPKGDFAFYDELPLRLRTIDFTKENGSFEIPLGPTVLEKPGLIYEFKPATISFHRDDRRIEVELKHEKGVDHFTLDGQFPYLLREWKMASGETWKMKNSLRVDYEKYDKAGDREKALKDPMLRHPD
jgi:hypothetical protein